MENRDFPPVFKTLGNSVKKQLDNLMQERSIKGLEEFCVNKISQLQINPTKLNVIYEIISFIKLIYSAVHLWNVILGSQFPIKTIKNINKKQQWLPRINPNKTTNENLFIFYQRYYQITLTLLVYISECKSKLQFKIALIF